MKKESKEKTLNEKYIVIEHFKSNDVEKRNKQIIEILIKYISRECL